MGVWLNRGRGWLAPLTAITGALIHAAMLDSGARQAGVSAWLHLPGELLGQFVVRGLEIPQFGVTGTMVANKLAPWPVVALGVLLPIAILLKCRDRRLLLMLATAWYLFGLFDRLRVTSRSHRLKLVRGGSTVTVFTGAVNSSRHGGGRSGEAAVGSRSKDAAHPRVVRVPRWHDP